MVYQSYYEPIYYPAGNYYDVNPVGGYLPFQPPTARGILYKINEYFFRGLVYIQNVLELLLSTSPFFEQYGPILEELPKMYHLVKAINEVSQNEDDVEIEIIEEQFDGPAPRLFI